MRNAELAPLEHAKAQVRLILATETNTLESANTIPFDSSNSLTNFKNKNSKYVTKMLPLSKHLHNTSQLSPSIVVSPASEYNNFKLIDFSDESQNLNLHNMNTFNINEKIESTINDSSLKKINEHLDKVAEREFDSKGQERSSQVINEVKVLEANSINYNNIQLSTTTKLNNIEDPEDNPIFFQNSAENELFLKNKLTTSKNSMIRKNDKNDKNEKNNVSKSKSKQFEFSNFRYIILFVSVLGIAATKSNEVSFNFTVICMTLNSTVNNDEPIAMNPNEISAVFAGGGIGAISILIPVVYALHYLGPRIVFTSLLLFSSFGTIILPTMGKLSPLWMVPARIMQGLALSAILPLMGCISAQWAPTGEIGKFMTLLTSANQISQIFTIPLSAKLCVTLGWSSVFHTHGIISALFAIIFFLVFRDSPRTHPCVNANELHSITSGINARNKRDGIPYSQILKSKAVWAVWVAFLGISFGYLLIVQFMPTFMNKVLSVPITKTGFAVAIPPLTQLIVKIGAGWISDKMNISELHKLRLFNSLAMVGCGTFFLPLGFLPSISAHKSIQQIVALFCFTSSISCLGMVACGSMKSATLIARDFSHFVMAVVQLIVCLGMLLVPLLVSWLAPNNTIAEWRSVFFAVFFLLIFNNLIFCKYCSAEVEPWVIRKNETNVYSKKLLIIQTNKTEPQSIIEVKQYM